MDVPLHYEDRVRLILMESKRTCHSEEIECFLHLSMPSIKEKKFFLSAENMVENTKLSNNGVTPCEVCQMCTGIMFK